MNRGALALIAVTNNAPEAERSLALHVGILPQLAVEFG